MKKIFCLFLYLVLFFGFSMANAFEAEVDSAVTLTTMPSDEEIMQTLDKFNFTPEQKELLFSQTKAQLQQMYNSNDGSALLNNYSLPEVQKTDKPLDVERPQLKERPKKYSNHEPLTRKSLVQPTTQVEEQKMPLYTENTQAKERVKKYSKHDPLTRRSATQKTQTSSSESGAQTTERVKKYSKHDPLTR